MLRAPRRTSPGPKYVAKPDNRLRNIVAGIAAALLVIAAAVIVIPQALTSTAPSYPIKHVIFIMQENRSFDSYFGTFPGADGIPMTNGKPAASTCNPDSYTKKCVYPYADHSNMNRGGPHGQVDTVADVNGGLMNGFEYSAAVPPVCKIFTDPTCAPSGENDVMGYHTGSDIPNYWAYAKNFVLQDHYFDASSGWSVPQHLFAVSGWSALCRTHDPKKCKSSTLNSLEASSGTPGLPKHYYAWTDITYLLHKYGVSWRYYVQTGSTPDCDDPTDITCTPGVLSSSTPSIWNPLPSFDDVKEDHQVHNVVKADQFFSDAKKGTLPAVSWVVPNGSDSEHPPALVSAGQSWVTSLVNAVMRGPDWKSTAIFVSWDDWGGFYDNVVPPFVDQLGYGIRAPQILISPYAKKGMVDHQTLSSDANLKLIEDLFLHGQRLNPVNDGRPDSRPDVRENVHILGDLLKEFNFHQKPRNPLILPDDPKTTLH